MPPLHLQGGGPYIPKNLTWLRRPCWLGAMSLLNAEVRCSGRVNTEQYIFWHVRLMHSRSSLLEKKNIFCEIDFFNDTSYLKKINFRNNLF